MAKNLLEMNKRLHLDDPMASHWARIDADLADYPIDAEGCLREWIDRREPADPGHRHLSHLYGLFPSSLFRGDARIEQAARKAIDRRLAGGLGHSASWSFAWYACLFARLGEGERAIGFLDHLVRGGLLPNLLTVHNDWRAGSQYSHMCSQKIFQIDALFGLAAALQPRIPSCYFTMQSFPTAKMCNGLCGGSAAWFQDVHSCCRKKSQKQKSPFSLDFSNKNGLRNW